ncbi:GPW/gp25 family protein [Alteromonas sp. a30]|uniref:GPW/gp25 family protein n=1 Tax=Alteromonas sp. a30 TaxID=2730917 RepID=UPI00227EE979|nr:GPW/gp25 family protein [Alteromonas sp. a30]MCY7294209.1 GPW/gp25 family protein [Alteromonas sp. a30]
MADIPPLQQVGWAFPPTFERDTRQPLMQTGLDNLAKCLQIMLSTAPGERNFHTSYGCDVSAYAFQGMSFELLELVEDIVEQSIDEHEPRIGIQDIQVGPNPNNDAELIVQVAYQTPEGESAVTQIPFNLNTGLPV